MNRFPTDDQLATALLWLRGNEGDAEESGACRAVADWLEIESNSRMLRTAARKGGIRTADLRARLAQQKGTP